MFGADEANMKMISKINVNDTTDEVHIQVFYIEKKPLSEDEWI